MLPVGLTQGAITAQFRETTAKAMLELRLGSPKERLCLGLGATRAALEIRLGSAVERLKLRHWPADWPTFPTEKICL